MYRSPHRFSRQAGETRPRNIFLLLVTVVLAWLLWSGLYKPVVLGLGAFSCVLVVYLATRLDFFTHADGIPRLLVRLPRFWLWLLKEIVVSSWQVAKIVLSPSLPIKPSLVVLDIGSEDEMPRVIFGNSITLSPGTITLDIDGQNALIHCLTEESAAAVTSGELQRRIAGLERHE